MDPSEEWDYLKAEKSHQLSTALNKDIWSYSTVIQRDVDHASGPKGLHLCESYCLLPQDLLLLHYRTITPCKCCPSWQAGYLVSIVHCILGTFSSVSRSAHILFNLISPEQVSHLRVQECNCPEIFPSHP